MSTLAQTRSINELMFDRGIITAEELETRQKEQADIMTGELLPTNILEFFSA